MKTEIKTHLAGTKQQYYTLRVLDGDKVIAVHTGKCIRYINKMKQRYTK